MLPAALLAALVLIAALQLALTRDPELPEAGVRRLPPATAIADPPRAFVDPAIGARPLFAPSRRAGGGPLVLGGAGPAPLGGATVAGGMKARGVARVLLKAPGGAIVSVRVGGTYQGWVLVSFSEEGAKFRKGSEIIRVAYGATGGAAPADASSSEDQ